MEVQVRVPGALRELVGGAAAVAVPVSAPGPSPVTVADVLDALALRWPALERRVRDERGVVRPHVNLFVGEDDVRHLGGVAAAVAPGVELSVIPAVSGG